jgi:hypothetical protein
LAPTLLAVLSQTVAIFQPALLALTGLLLRLRIVAKAQNWNSQQFFVDIFPNFQYH